MSEDTNTCLKSAPVVQQDDGLRKTAAQCRSQHRAVRLQHFTQLAWELCQVSGVRSVHLRVGGQQRKGANQGL